MTTQPRQCPHCHQTEPAAEFYAGTNRYCKPCWRAYVKDRWASETPVPAAKPTRRADDHDARMLQHGEAIVRQCPRAYHALDVITSGWWAMNRSKA